MRAAAAGTMVDLAVMIDRVIAAGARVERGAGNSLELSMAVFLNSAFAVPTVVELLGFKDDP